MLAQNWKDEQTRRIKVEKEKAILEAITQKQTKAITVAVARLDADAPKVEFADRITNSDRLFPFTKVAKILQLPFGRNILFEKLRDERVLMKNNEPYQHYIDQGYFEHKLNLSIQRRSCNIQK